MTLENDELRVVVNPHGAELASLRRRDDGVELLWQGDQRSWPRRAPWLFPIVGRLREDRYQYRGAEFRLPQHGFARDCDFLPVDVLSQSATFRLTEDASTLEVYPFRFVFDVAYRLEDSSLRVELVVFNPGDGQLLFSVGAHPGFRCPVDADERLSDYRIELEHPETTARRLVVNGLIGDREGFLACEQGFPLSTDLFSRGAIVLDGLLSERVSLVSSTTGRGIQLGLPGFPYLGIWSKPPGAFVCLEPWCGIADAVDARGDFEGKEGVVRLTPGQRFVRELTIRPFGPGRS